MSEAPEPAAGAERALAHWQRLSPWAVGLLLVTSGVSLVRQHLPLLLGAGAGLALVERVGLREVGLGAALLLLVAALLSLLYYRRFRFRLDGEVLVIQKGLFEHREFKVAARHVQHIAVHQPLYLRPFAVVQWQVETLAGEASRIELPGIRRELADALGRRLQLGGRAEAASAPPAEGSDGANRPGSRVRYAITPRALVLHGLTSRSIYVIAAMLSPLVRPVERWLQEHLPHLELRAWLPDSPLAALGLGLVAVVAVLALLAVLAAWWRFHGYVLRDHGERQVQVSGLFHRQEQVLSLARLQVVEWVQTGLGRALGRGYLVCHQFGGLGGDAAESRRFLVPGLTPAEGEALVGGLWPGSGRLPSLERVSRVYPRVLFLRTLLGLSAGLAVLVWLLGPERLPPWAWALLAVGSLGLAAGTAQLRWQAVGWARQGAFLFVRQGLWSQRTSVFPLRHLVSLGVQQSWLQRRRGVATLQLYLANGRLTLPFLEAPLAWALADRLLASVEGVTGGSPAGWPRRSDDAARH
ncbi:PH domain-containing protein [Halomonas sp. BM-2019]|uniref:PH domain-containing protein n=1 Tax=Halomonas sp. BM-2019 TaxID=2811227 RepID=UPI001B3C4612|nr:MAG: PH domain-containing protein [Halomonas sp. BM-2019]